MSQTQFQLYYWPIPSLGCFFSYLFAYRGAPLIDESDFDEIEDLISRDPGNRDVPFMGPSLIRDLEKNRALSQVPASVLYVSP